MKKLLLGLITTLFLICMIGIGNATIINLDALINTNLNPVVVNFEPGTYEVIPIGVSEGGNYNAWNAWGYVSLPLQGWINNYSLSFAEFGPFLVSDGLKYATDLEALNNARSTSFTLTSADTVQFYIADIHYPDNEGGMSLSVNLVPPPSAVPEPTTMLLLASGLVGLAGLRRKFRK